jgi:hypothetical protein
VPPACRWDANTSAKSRLSAPAIAGFSRVLCRRRYLVAFGLAVQPVQSLFVGRYYFRLAGGGMEIISVTLRISSVVSF